MPVKTFQRSFAGGEISSQMWGRIDDARYQSGLAVCKNFIPLPQGPVENRPGTEFIREVKDSSKPVRLIPFTFSDSDTMVLELGDRYCRFHTKGATLVKDGAPYEIATPWAAEDVFGLQCTQSNDILTVCHVNYAPREIRRYSALDWRVETIGFGAPLSAPGGVSAVRATSAADDQNADKYTQRYRVTALNADKTRESAASGTASCVANLFAYGTTVRVSWNAVAGASFYRVYKCQGGVYGYIGETDELSIIDDDIAPETGTTPPRYGDTFEQGSGIRSVSVTSGGSGYSSADGSLGSAGAAVGEERLFVSSISALAYNESALRAGVSCTLRDDGGTGYGGAVELDYSIEPYSHSYTKEENDAGEVTVTQRGYRLVVNRIKVTAPGRKYSRPVATVTLPKVPFSEMAGGKLWTSKDFSLPVETGVEVSVTDTTGSGAKLKAVVSGGAVTGIQIVQAGSGYTNPRITITGLLGGSGAAATASVGKSGDWPGCSTYHEQRRCFAGTASHPQRMWMTKSSTESDMSYHLPSVDEDRILFEVASTESSRILHMCSLSGGMVLLTGTGEWRVTSVNNDAITPSSVSVKAQSYVGAGKAQPMVVNNILLYPAARGGHVRELAFNYNAQGYITGDLCLRSAHLFDHYEIRQIAFTKAPQPVVWFVSTSGKLLTLTYVPEQQVGAWAQQATDGVFESVAAVGEELEDAVYVVVRRVVNGKVRRYVERFHERSFTDPARAFFVDCGATYEGDPVTTISGLSWLEGKTVSILADGAVAPQRVVKDGRIELDHAASIVTVGLPYVSEAQTLPMIIQTQDGAFGQALEKNVCAASVRVYESSGVWAGPSEEALREYKQRTTELPGSPPALATGEIELAVTPAWGKSGQVVFEQTDPLPLTLLSLTLKAAA